MIRAAPRRQSAQFGAFQRDQLLAPGIAPANEVGDPIAIELEAVEVSAAAQQQGLSNGTLEVTVLALDRAVLVRYAAVVAGRLHAIEKSCVLVRVSSSAASARAPLYPSCASTAGRA